VIIKNCGAQKRKEERSPEISIQENYLENTRYFWAKKKKKSVLLVTSANKRGISGSRGKGDSVLTFRVMTPYSLACGYFNN
jgi:hypothetical protein